MADFVQLPVVQALAWALMHFVWQGAAIGLAALLTFRVVRTSARARYVVGVIALATMLVAPVVTFLLLYQPGAPAIAPDPAAIAGEVAVSAIAPVSPADIATAPDASAFRVAPELLAAAVMGWLAGVAFFAIRLLGGWLVARRLAHRAVQPAADHLQTLARQLASRLEVRRLVTVWQSSAVAVPVMVGWLKPAIILPVAALAGLTPTQMESLLAHELAHVRRHDYLINLLQSVVEALLFYHPAVWWLSRRVRAERELCCDDLAVGVCDRLVYATALTDLAAMASPRVALAATDGDLLSRVRRILGQTDAAPVLRAGVMPVLALALIAGVAVPVSLASATQAPVTTAQDARRMVTSESQATVEVPSVRLESQGTLRTEPGPVTGWAFEGPADVAQSAQQTEQLRQELLRKLEELQRELAQLEGRRTVEIRSSAERQNQQDVLALNQATREAQIQSARRQFDAAKQRFEKGLITEAELKQAEAALKRAEAQGNAQEGTSADQLKAEAQLARTRSLFERGLNNEQQVRDAEVALAKERAAGNAQERAAIDRQQAESQLERARSLFERGLMSQQQFQEAEMAAAKTRAAGNQEAMAAAQIQEAVSQLARARELADRGLASSQKVAELEAALRDLSERLADQRKTPRDVRPELAQAARDRAAADNRRLLDQQVDVRRADPAAERSANVPFRTIAEANLQPVANAAEPIKNGDVLRIAIQGEPDLPNTFQVTNDGTIRMPFIGAIKVAGLTADQVRETVGKQLASHKLGSADQVKVTLLRQGRGR